MATSGSRTRLSIDVDPELRRRIEVAAAERDLSVRDYVASILRRAVESSDDESPLETATWQHASASTFARDWDSEEDAVYDNLS